MDWEVLRPELDVALNEATLLGFEVDVDRRLGAATFAVLSLPEAGMPDEDNRVQLLLEPVGRVWASLRNGRWNDGTAAVVSFPLADLLPIVQSFGGLPIYGWEFFDVHDRDISRWGDRLSLDWQSGSDGVTHSLRVFQEGSSPDRHLDLTVWFDSLTARKPDGTAVPLETFAAAGRRWWDGLFAGDPRTSGRGVMPYK